MGLQKEKQPSETLECWMTTVSRSYVSFRLFSCICVIFICLKQEELHHAMLFCNWLFKIQHVVNMCPCWHIWNHSIILNGDLLLQGMAIPSVTNQRFRGYRELSQCSDAVIMNNTKAPLYIHFQMLFDYFLWIYFLGMQLLGQSIACLRLLSYIAILTSTRVYQFILLQQCKKPCILIPEAMFHLCSHVTVVEESHTRGGECGQGIDSSPSKSWLSSGHESILPKNQMCPITSESSCNLGPWPWASPRGLAPLWGFGILQRSRLFSPRLHPCLPPWLFWSKSLSPSGVSQGWPACSKKQSERELLTPASQQLPQRARRF